MEKIKEKLINLNIKQKISEHKYLAFCFLITIMFLGNMSRLEYSRCTYRMYANDYLLEYEHYLVIGRYIVALFWKLVNILKFSINVTYFLSYALGVCSMTLSIYILFRILKKYVKANFLSLLLAAATVLNVYFIDYFIYLEKGVFTLSILLCVISFWHLLKFFEIGRKRNLIYSFIFLCLSSFSYQGTVALYVALATIFIIRYSSSIKKFIVNNVITAGIYGGTMGASYLLVRLVGSRSTSRTTGNIHIMESIKKTLNGLYTIFINSYGIMPRYFFAVTFALVFLIVVILIFSLKNREGALSKKQKVLVFLGYIYALLGCVISAILPQLAIDTGAINVAARSVYPFASIISLSIIYLLVNTEFELKVTRKIFAIILLTFMTLQCYEFNVIITDRYTLNYIEKEYVYLIGEQIEKYEAGNNITVNSIIFYKDKNSRHSYPDLKSYADINERVLLSTWCRREIINFYLDRNFDQGWEQNEEYKKEFESVDYEWFNENQFKFDGDTLHLCIY